MSRQRRTPDKERQGIRPQACRRNAGCDAGHRPEQAQRV